MDLGKSIGVNIRIIIKIMVIVQVYNRKMHCEQDIMGSRGLLRARGGGDMKGGMG
ncbi:hypothetical protein MBAV_000998 [Candidatus Magnetobacterium bavaricum]|uniref:Uncharacterized protein n=1 Tax=Candidatus Magnetobacterium bavaricum TaxID=29290 RepID=A0A0F3GXY6_9BACT|nr:hypothetical protein MBAV_000998 [Candidatus Magnetobacterium bavaricum]